MRYHRSWLDELDSAHKKWQLIDDHRSCEAEGRSEARFNVACNLGANPGTLRDLESVFGPSVKALEKCSMCQFLFLTFELWLQFGVSGLPKFSTLL